MRRFLVAVFVVLAFSGMAVAQPAAAGPDNGPGGPPGDDAPDQDDGDEDVDEEDDSPEEDSDDESERGPPEDLGEDVDNETEENETEMEEDGELNETRGPPEGAPGRSAQFDARLMTAINTLETLVDIAPSDEASSQLQESLDIMRGVQNSTDTASLGPEDTEDDSETEMNETEEENETVEKESEANLEQEESEDQGREDRGPPGFVRNFLSGIFGR